MSKGRFYASQFFSLDIHPTARGVRMTMQMHVPYVNTRALAHTFPFLQKHFPSVLATRCFNDQNLPFALEVRATELAHLFEHIMLDHLCLVKIAEGSNNAQFSGRTSWNWKKEPYGLFHIAIEANKKDHLFFPHALGRTIVLMEQLLTTKTTDNVQEKLPVVDIRTARPL